MIKLNINKGHKPLQHSLKRKVDGTRNEKLPSSNHEDSPKAWRESIKDLPKKRSTTQRMGPTLIGKYRKYGLVQKCIKYGSHA